MRRVDRGNIVRAAVVADQDYGFPLHSSGLCLLPPWRRYYVQSATRKFCIRKAGIWITDEVNEKETVVYTAHMVA